MMEYSPLGSTELEVSRICLGTRAFGRDWGRYDREDAIAVGGPTPEGV